MFLKSILIIMLLDLTLLSSSYAADLPPSVDDVKALKKEVPSEALSKQVPAGILSKKVPEHQLMGTSRALPEENEPISPSEARSSLPKPEGQEDVNVTKTKSNEDLKTKDTPINALGNVISENDQSVNAKIKEWSKKAGEFYQTFEEYMGWDESTRLKKLDDGCRSNAPLACFELAEIRQREGKTFEAETWYQLACSLKHSPSCDRYKRLAAKRESYEQRLRGERLEIESLCESGGAASCAKAAYIAKYFGERSISETLNLKSCNLGYPAGCLQVSKSELEKGNLEASKEFEKKGRSLLNSH